MSTAVLDPSASDSLTLELGWPSGKEATDTRAGPSAVAQTSGRNLDELVSTLWAELERGASVSCPVCAATIGGKEPADGAAHCEGCGSILS